MPKKNLFYFLVGKIGVSLMFGLIWVTSSQSLVDCFYISPFVHVTLFRHFYKQQRNKITKEKTKGE
jgi:hypothetical protein